MSTGDFTSLEAKLEHLERAVESLEKSILEIRVALLGGLDGRPGLLSQMSTYASNLQNVRNEIKFAEAKIETQHTLIAGLQKDSWFHQGKLVGGGGVLGLLLSKLMDLLK